MCTPRHASAAHTITKDRRAQPERVSVVGFGHMIFVLIAVLDKLNKGISGKEKRERERWEKKDTKTKKRNKREFAALHPTRAKGCVPNCGVSTTKHHLPYTHTHTHTRAHTSVCMPLFRTQLLIIIIFL